MSWLQRALIAVACLLIVASLYYFGWTLMSRFQRIDLAELSTLTALGFFISALFSMAQSLAIALLCLAAARLLGRVDWTNDRKTIASTIDGLRRAGTHHD